MNTSLSRAACVSLFLSAVAYSAPAQDQKATPTDPAELQRKWQEFAEPSEAHEIFQYPVGKWKVELKSFEGDADESQASEGRAEFRLLMGGRYLEQEFEGTFEGHEFQGRGLMAYDKTQKKYVTTWIDNLSTAIMISEGRWMEDEGKFIEEGKTASPFGEMQSRAVWQHVDDNKFTVTIYMTPPGQEEIKAMELTYLRQ